MISDRTFFITTVAWQRTNPFRNEEKAHLMLGILGITVINKNMFSMNS